MRVIIFFSLLLSTMSVLPLAHAANLSFLSSTSIGNLNKEEREDLRTFVIEALNSHKELEKSAWESTKGSQALFKVLADYTYQDQECRRIKFAVRASKQRRYQTALWNLCKSGEEWQKVEAPLASLSESDRESIKQDLFETLESGANAHPVTFKYSGIGLQVVATPFDEMDSSHKDKPVCRTLSVSIFDKESAMLSGSYRFCLDAKEGWQHQPEN
jgi:hypothetical protein